ncbi:MAG: ATPase [Agathobacter sp.]|nr:ATPase [Agathobacter sp.]
MEMRLKEFPEGKLICKRNKKRYKWYHTKDGNQIYIPKKNRTLAETLAAKKYLQHLHDDLLHEKNAIDFYLRHHKQGNAEKMLTEMPEYQELLSPYFKVLSQELWEWQKSPYDYNMKYPEQRKYKTATGNVVRSKSEVLIDMALYIHNIPFRYECALELGDLTLYPDFTIRHPKTGEVYYWEHFGKMDDDKYAKNTGSKLQFYIAHGITPGIQLITTYETKEKPLSSETVENIIKEYFI